MIPDIISATYIDHYNIEITFDDGKKGVVDFSKYLEKGGIFDRFKDIEYFKNFAVNEELGIIAWKDGVDVSPETLYSAATGAPLPAWVES
ncbi:hypothetical protein A2V82_04520 [candidate division KSB1 bacterium RBG_16_48_16]|nr:MAG: hypothetical protein A2V82_04520 [candidate division KSB1 bacterium RBG_16_48_16]